jgi:hypothetical protein
MGHGGSNVRITCATEDEEVLIRGCGAEKSDMKQTTLIVFVGRHFSRYMVVWCPSTQ